MQRNALISVTDKDGIVPFARSLQKELDFNIIATDGTATLLRSNKVPVTTVSEYTGVRPLLEPQGVKSIHHKIFAGVMSDLYKENHRADLKEIKAVHFDLVVCTFYDIENPLAKGNKLFEEVMKEVDIGGPAMVRAGGKNLKNVVIIGDKRDYQPVLRQYLENGEVDPATRVDLAIKAFEYTKSRDEKVINYLRQSKPEIVKYLEGLIKG